MANTTSGTVTFDKTFAVDEIIKEAYERLGVQVSSGYQLKTDKSSNSNQSDVNLVVPSTADAGNMYTVIAEFKKLY